MNEWLRHTTSPSTLFFLLTSHSKHLIPALYYYQLVIRQETSSSNFKCFYYYLFSFTTFRNLSESSFQSLEELLNISGISNVDDHRSMITNSVGMTTYILCTI